jgi:hypothetical protein
MAKAVNAKCKICAFPPAKRTLSIKKEHGLRQVFVKQV